MYALFSIFDNTQKQVITKLEKEKMFRNLKCVGDISSCVVVVNQKRHDENGKYVY